nr:DNA primase [Streptomyces sp. SID8374]
MWSRARETHGPRRVDRRGPVKRVGRTRAQAADVPLDDEAGAGADDEDDDEALDFASEPVDEDDEPESDDFEVDVAGVLLDEEPRLSFR